MKERRLVLAFDCDDVLIQTAGKVIKHFETTYNTVVDPAHFYEGTAEQWGVGDLRTVNRRIEKYFSHFSHELLIPDPEALIAIPALARSHELHLVTGRAEFMEPVTQQMADEHFPGCFSSITHTNFFKPRFRRTKGQVCKELGANILVDDHIKHCESVLDEGVDHAILFGNHAWIKDENLRQGIIRGIDWPTTQREIGRIAGRELSFQN